MWAVLPCTVFQSLLLQGQEPTLFAQKQMLVAVAKENPARHPTSGAFVRRNALDSPSSAQKAIAKLLDGQLITYTVSGGEKEYSVADKFFERWLRETY